MRFARFFSGRFAANLQLTSFSVRSVLSPGYFPEHLLAEILDPPLEGNGDRIRRHGQRIPLCCFLLGEGTRFAV